MSNPSFIPGCEHIVDAHGCNDSALRSKPVLQHLVARILSLMQLRGIGEPLWHVFPDPGGLTGLVMLAESHLSVHTFPEHRYVAINVYCCRQTAELAWETELRALLGAEAVVVRSLVRGGGAGIETAPSSSPTASLQRGTPAEPDSAGS